MPTWLSNALGAKLKSGIFGAMRKAFSLTFVVLAVFASAACLRAENGSAAWLRYAPITDPGTSQLYSQLPAATVSLDSSLIELTAQNELVRGVQSMLGRTLRIESEMPGEDCILLGTLASVNGSPPGSTCQIR